MLLAFTALLWIATAVKAVQLLRAPDDRLLCTVAGGLTSAAIAFTVGRHPVEKWLDSVVIGLPSLVRNLGMIAVFYSLLAFFAYATTYRDRAIQDMRRHRVIVGTLLALAVIVWATAPDSIRADPRAAASAGLRQGTAFQLLAVLALLYTVIAALRHTLHFARRAQRTHLRIGLRILVAGLGAAFVANALSASVTVMGLVLPSKAPVLTAARMAYMVVIIVAIPGLAIGLAYPIVASMARAAPTWLRHWCEYRALRPLWREVHRAFPALTLRRSIGAVRPWSIHARRYRRACEIRDGLVMLAPYYPVYRTRSTLTTVDAHAAHVREALLARTEARADGSEPIGGPVATPIPQGESSDDMNADIRWLVDLSRALPRVQTSD